VQAIRDLLDANACCLVVKDRNCAPLSIDSSVRQLCGHRLTGIRQRGRDTPESVPMTSFLDPLRALQGRPGDVRAGRIGDRPPAARRSGARRRSLHHHRSATTSAGSSSRLAHRYVGAKLEFVHVQVTISPGPRRYRWSSTAAAVCTAGGSCSAASRLPCGWCPHHQLRPRDRYPSAFFDRALRPFPAAMPGSSRPVRGRPKTV